MHETRPPASRPQRASSRDGVERRPRHRLELAGLGDLVDVEPGVEEHSPPAEVVGRLDVLYEVVEVGEVADALPVDAVHHHEVVLGGPLRRGLASLEDGQLQRREELLLALGIRPGLQPSDAEHAHDTTGRVR